MALNKINFSNGIRPEEIQENFEYLQEQLSRERVSVGGAGISSGLDIISDVSENSFNLIITDGSVIDDEGNEVFIKGTTLAVTPPKLQEYREYCVMNEDKEVFLKFSPYALNRRRPVEYLSSFEPEKSGITIKYKNSLNIDDYLRVRNINDKVLTVTGAMKRDLEVSYYYTAKRIDTLYIDNNLEIKIQEAEGTTSTTPSVSKLPNDAKYLLAYIEVDHEYMDEIDNLPHAYMYVKDDLREIRNLYTSKDGTLYICGVPFDDLQIIHMKEPKNPKPYTLWLNIVDNTLYCWRATDEFVYKNKIEVTTDFSENPNAGLTYSTYVGYNIGENELSVYLNGAKLLLGRDYEEYGTDIPTLEGNVGTELVRGNGFKILNTLERPDNFFKDVLVPGDIITYVVRYKDSQYMWVPVNKMNYTTVKNKRIYSTFYDDIPDEYIYEIIGNDKKAYFDSALANSLGIDSDAQYHYKYQYFLFDRVKDLDMHYTPGKNELSIMINQMCLHEDQFKEITIYDLVENTLPTAVLSAAKTQFGWTSQYLNDYTENTFDNSGIGFMLIEPLDAGAKADSISSHYTNYDGSNDLFVEVSVEHRVCSTPINRKLERSATFVSEGTIIVNPDISESKIVDLEDVKYRFDENQLEVFLDGIKQIIGVDYIEEFGYLKDGIEILPISKDIQFLDQDYYLRKKAALCTKFKFMDEKTLSVSSKITYRITTNVYSYDHINNMFDDIADTLEQCKETLSSSESILANYRSNLDDRISNLEDRIDNFEFNNVEDGGYLTSDSIINLGQLPAMIVNNSIKSLNHINTSIELSVSKSEYVLNDIYAEDFVIAIYHDVSKQLDSYWVNGIHYRLIDTGKEVFLRVLNMDKVETSDILYLTGLKVSNKRIFEESETNNIYVTKEYMEEYVSELLKNLKQ